MEAGWEGVTQQMYKGRICLGANTPDGQTEFGIAHRLTDSHWPKIHAWIQLSENPRHMRVGSNTPTRSNISEPFFNSCCSHPTSCPVYETRTCEMLYHSGLPRMGRRGGCSLLLFLANCMGSEKIARHSYSPECLQKEEHPHFHT